MKSSNSAPPSSQCMRKETAAEHLADTVPNSTRVRKSTMTYSPTCSLAPKSGLFYRAEAEAVGQGFDTHDDAPANASVMPIRRH